MKKVIKCDKCNASSKNTKIYSKKNYPFGKKSKPTIIRLCRRCKNPKLAKETDKMIAQVIKNSDNGRFTRVRINSIPRQVQISFFGYKARSNLQNG